MIYSPTGFQEAVGDFPQIYHYIADTDAEEGFRLERISAEDATEVADEITGTGQRILVLDLFSDEVMIEVVDEGGKNVECEL